MGLSAEGKTEGKEENRPESYAPRPHPLRKYGPYIGPTEATIYNGGPTKDAQQGPTAEAVTGGTDGRDNLDHLECGGVKRMETPLLFYFVPLYIHSMYSYVYIYS